MTKLPPNYREIEDRNEWNASHHLPGNEPKTIDDTFTAIISYLNDHDMHGNQGLWQTAFGLMWIRETAQGWRYQMFREPRTWPQ